MKFGPPRYQFRRFEIIKRLNRQKGKTFLEIGAGSLFLTKELIQKGFSKGTVVEFNKEAFRVHKKLPPPVKKKVKIITEDFLKLDLSEKYDFVIACEVIEHVQNDKLFLKKMSDLLKPDGQLIISVPAKMKYWSTDDEAAGHYRRYDKDNVIALLHTADVKPLEFISYGYPFVNLLRYLRIWYFNKKAVKLNKLSKTERSKLIGHSGLDNFLLALTVNKYTFFLFCLFASLFNSFNLSDGYLIFGKANNHKK